MRVPLKWLLDYVDVDLPSSELARLLTLAGIETEAANSTPSWEGIVVAQVRAVQPHPNANRLRLATVDLGSDEILTVVCGAPNIAPSQKVAFARVGARLIDGHSGERTSVRSLAIRGIESAGMVCSERELGVSEMHDGILVLPDDAPVGIPLDQYLGDVILSTDITPNRPDLFSVLGLAREVAALTGASLQAPDITYWEDGPPIKDRVKVGVEATDLCSRYCAALIEDIQVGDSPAWMQERLTAAGFRPISNVVDVTNYVMLEMGQPLHAFDLTSVGESTIVVRRARDAEKLTTLDGVERNLSSDTLIIADAKVPIALAGIMGGAHTQITAKTGRVLIESACFDAISIRRTSSSLGVRTESSLRFEKGLGPDLAIEAIKRAAKLMVQITGGRATKGINDTYPRKARPTRVTVSKHRLEQILGVDLPHTRVRQVLTSLGFGCRWISPSQYVIRAPYWRTDVRIPDDVSEEIARIIGYDKLPARMLNGEIPSMQPQPLRDLRQRVQDALASAGMQEVINYSLTDMDTLARVCPPELLKTYPPLRVANPMNQRQDCLRVTLRSSLLETAAANIRFGRDSLAIFEAGRIYLRRDADLPEEVEMAAGLICGGRFDRWGRTKGEAMDFYDAKGYLEHLLASLALSASYHDSEEFGMMPGRTARVLVQGNTVGVIGEIHPGVAEAWDIQQRVYLFEVNLEALLPYVQTTRRVATINRLPTVDEDLAIVVDESIPAGRVLSIIESFPLVRSATLFDVYAGFPIEEGKRSLAFSLTYHSQEHTLTDSEVEKERNAILARLAGDLGAQLRK